MPRPQECHRPARDVGDIAGVAGGAAGDAGRRRLVADRSRVRRPGRLLLVYHPTARGSACDCRRRTGSKRAPSSSRASTRAFAACARRSRLLVAPGPAFIRHPRRALSAAGRGAAGERILRRGPRAHPGAVHQHRRAGRVSLVALVFWLVLRDRMPSGNAGCMATQMLYLLCSNGEGVFRARPCACSAVSARWASGSWHAVDDRGRAHSCPISPGHARVPRPEPIAAGRCA